MNILHKYIEQSQGNTFIEGDPPFTNLDDLSRRYQQALSHRSTLPALINQLRGFHSPDTARTETDKRLIIHTRENLVATIWPHLPLLRERDLALDLTGSVAFSDMNPQSDLDLMFSTDRAPNPRQQTAITTLTNQIIQVTQGIGLKHQELRDLGELPPFTTQQITQLSDQLSPLNSDQQPSALYSESNHDVVSSTGLLLTSIGLGPLTTHQRISRQVSQIVLSNPALDALISQNLADKVLSDRLQRRSD